MTNNNIEINKMTFDDLMKEVMSTKKLELINHDFGRTFIVESFISEESESVSKAFGWIAKHTSMNEESTGFVAVFKRQSGDAEEKHCISITPDQLFVLRGELFKRTERGSTER